MVTRTKRAGEDRLIKKYPNRRLYDTQTSTYVTLSDIKGLVMASEVFKVIDAKTDEDLTRNILLQIILEEEAGGAPVFSSQMLSQIIRFYGNSMQGLMGNYMEQSKDLFVKMQEQMQNFSFAVQPNKTEKE
jgi:polyhydroxyalkanoate synthesis repressor PhaR